MRGAAAGQAEAGSGLRQMVGVCGEGGVGSEGDESGFVGVESWGAAAVAAAVGGAVKDGAYETGWISLYRAQTGRSGVQRLSVAVSGGGMGAAFAAAPAAVVCDAHCCLHSLPHCLLHLVCPLQQLRLCWRSEKGSAPACPRKTPQSFA